MNFNNNPNYDGVENELNRRIKHIDFEKIIKTELSQNKRFSLYEESKELLIYFNHGERGPTNAHIGFPFPIKTFECPPSLNHLKLDIFIRGEPLREIQRKIIQENSDKYTEPLNFVNTIQTALKKPNRIIYLDPYEFIGDSFIGLYFLDSFKKNLDVANSIVFSNQYKHLAAETTSQNYTIEHVLNELKDGDLIIAPDLIDTHWNKTLQFIENARNKNIQMAIPGRGLFLEFNNGLIKTYHSKGEDTLLLNKNIEDYMADCLDTFGIQGVAKFQTAKFHNTFKFFINPFASQELRYISPELVFNTYKLLKDENKLSEFYLIAGYHKESLHIEWLNKFLTMLKNDGSMRRISINYYSDLSELATHLKEKECGTILTADTSISHVANRFGYPNITIYNPIWWDANSLQSLSGSSPAGFARYTHNQIPLINDSYNLYETKNTAKLIANALLFFQKTQKQQKELFSTDKASWMTEIYSPSRIIQTIAQKEGSDFIKSAAIKVSATYKLENLP